MIYRELTGIWTTGCNTGIASCQLNKVLHKVSPSKMLQVVSSSQPLICSNEPMMTLDCEHVWGLYRWIIKYLFVSIWFYKERYSWWWMKPEAFVLQNKNLLLSYSDIFSMDHCYFRRLQFLQIVQISIALAWF